MSADQRQHILDETREHFLAHFGEINEDTMPGELANVMAGRIANLFNFRGPNFTTDAACASGLAAMSVAVEGLVDHRFDAAITGGIDHNMGVSAFVKFCKIGALSATGTRPFDAGADGFVMGEGAALFVLKRLEDAERDGDRIYSVILGIAGSSDGKGKGITAPNPSANVWPCSAPGTSPVRTLRPSRAVEAHGTSTRVGDAAELQSLTEVFGTAGADRTEHRTRVGQVEHRPPQGGGGGGRHVQDGAQPARQGAPAEPQLQGPEPERRLGHRPLRRQHLARVTWPEPPAGVRRAGVSAFGFGGTNFHVVMEEHVPGRHKPPAAAVRRRLRGSTGRSAGGTACPPLPPIRPSHRLEARWFSADVTTPICSRRSKRRSPTRGPGGLRCRSRPDPAIGDAAVRIAVDFADAADLAGKLEKAVKALTANNPAIFKMLRQQGVFVGRGPAPKVAFLYTGSGLAVRQHARPAPLDRTDRGRDVRARPTR